MKVPGFYFCIYPALIFIPPKWNCPSIPSQIAYIIPIGLKYHLIILRILTCNLVSPGTQFCPTDLTFSCLDTFINLLPFYFQICPSRYILSIPVVRKNFQKHSLTVLCHCLKLQYMFAWEKKAKWSSVYRLTCSNTAQLTTFCHNGSWQAMPLLEFRSIFLFLLWPHPIAFRILVFNQQLNPGPRQLKHQVLTTGLPEHYQPCHFKKGHSFFLCWYDDFFHPWIHQINML